MDFIYTASTPMRLVHQEDNLNKETLINIPCVPRVDQVYTI